MRPIKYRMWDKKNKFMADVWKLTCGERPQVSTLGSKMLDKARSKVEGDTVLMQWTGLVDKNGVDVYEGDIVKYRDISNTDQVGTVEWNSIMPSFRFYAIGGDDEGNQDIEPYKSDGLKNYEVIGNIHANPDLLKGTE